MTPQPKGVQLVRIEDLGTAMHQAIDPAGLMQRIADQTLEIIPGADGVMIGLADRMGVSYVWSSGANAAALLGTRVNLDSSLSGSAIKNRRVTWSEDIQTDPRADQELARRISVRSAVCMPLIRDDEILGVMSVVAVQPHAFDQGDTDRLTRLAGYVSSAISLTRDLARVTADLVELTNA